MRDAVGSAEARQYQYLCARGLPDQTSGELHAIHFRHHQVYYRDIGLEPDGHLEASLPIASVADDGDPMLRAEKGGEPHAHDGVIVNQKYGDFLHERACVRDRRAATVSLRRPECGGLGRC